jgi:Flp pilus assembly protein TadD
MVGSAAGLACLLASLAAPCMAATTPAAGKPDSDRCRAVDACYDAIRRNPSDPSLLSALGDALLRANRPVDALRTYQRVASLAPSTPGIAAKISAVQAKLSAKRTPGNPPLQAASADAAGKRYSNAAPETQSH